MAGESENTKLVLTIIAISDDDLKRELKSIEIPKKRWIFGE
jgi:hypothetical protein